MAVNSAVTYDLRVYQVPIFPSVAPSVSLQYKVVQCIGRPAMALQMTVHIPVQLVNCQVLRYLVVLST